MATDTRHIILDAALHEFSTIGYESTTVASICRRAGVSNGSLFHFFKTKEALAEALHLYAIDQYQSGFLHVLALSADDPATSVRNMVRFHLSWVEKNSELAQFMQWPAQPRERRELSDKLKPANQGFLSALSDWAMPLQKQRRLRKMPMPALVAALIGPAQIICRSWLNGISDDKPTSHAKTLGDVAWSGLAPPQK